MPLFKRNSLLFRTDGIFNRLLIDWLYQQSLYTPILLVQEMGDQQMTAPVQARFGPVQPGIAGEKRAFGLVIIKRRAFADIIGIAFAFPLRQPMISDRADCLAGQRVRNFMSNKVVQGALA